LLTAFKHFLNKQWDHARAQKRGGGQTVLSLDFERANSSLQFEPSENLTPEACYERQWALTLLANILDQLQQEMDDGGKGAQFGVLKDFLVAEGEPQRYATVAAQLGISEAAARKAASRLRQRYRELLRGAILQTVSGPEEVEDELHNLFHALSLR
jgi:RNA polymerase sigma-70 factor (ECF subfamily)